MLSITLYPNLKQEVRLLVLFVIFSCIVSQKKVKMIQGNFLTTKHILNVITNVMSNLITPKAKPDVCTKSFHLTKAQYKKYMI